MGDGAPAQKPSRRRGSLLKKQPAPISFRRALPSDRDAVFEICRHTWEDGDYIPQVWRNWIADRRGFAAVGELDGRVVTFGHINYLSKSVAWLEGLRVDPALRGQGLASAQHHYFVNKAQKMGFGSVRLATHHQNFPIHWLCEKTGFTRRARFALTSSKPISSSTPAVLWPTLPPQAVWEFVRNSAEYQLGDGMHESNWTWYDLTAPRFRRYYASSRCFVYVRSDNIKAVALACGGSRKTKWRLGALFGDEKSAATLLRKLKKHPNAVALGGLGLSVVADSAAFAGALAAGFEFCDELWVFEKQF